MFMFICRYSKKKKKSYKVLELSELKCSRNKINSILYVCLFVDNLKKKKKLQGTQAW